MFKINLSSVENVSLTLKLFLLRLIEESFYLSQKETYWISEHFWFWWLLTDHHRFMTQSQVPFLLYIQYFCYAKSSASYLSGKKHQIDMVDDGLLCSQSHKNHVFYVGFIIFYAVIWFIMETENIPRCCFQISST